MSDTSNRVKAIFFTAMMLLSIAGGTLLLSPAAAAQFSGDVTADDVTADGPAAGNYTATLNDDDNSPVNISINGVVEASNISSIEIINGTDNDNNVTAENITSGFTSPSDNATLITDTNGEIDVSIEFNEDVTGSGDFEVRNASDASRTASFTVDTRAANKIEEITTDNPTAEGTSETGNYTAKLDESVQANVRLNLTDGGISADNITDVTVINGTSEGTVDNETLVNGNAIVNTSAAGELDVAVTFDSEVNASDTFNVSISSADTNISADDTRNESFFVDTRTASDATLSNLDIAEEGTDATIKEGVNENVSVDVENIGGESGSFQVNLTIENDTVQVEQNKTRDLAGGANTTVTFEDVTGALGNDSYDVNVTTDNASIEGNLTVNEATTDLSATISNTSAPVFENENLVVEINITNTGNENADSIDADLQAFNGTTVDSDTGITVDADSNTTVELVWELTEGAVDTANLSEANNISVEIDHNDIDSPLTREVVVDDADAPVYHVDMVDNGETYTLGFPGPIEGDLSDALPDTDAVYSVYAYDAANNEWNSGSDIDEDVSELDAVVITTEGETDETLGFRVELQTENDIAVPGTRNVEPGWNLISASQFAGADTVFTAGSGGDGELVLDRFSNAQKINSGNTSQIAQPAEFNNEFIDSTTQEVNPFKGYWVSVSADGEIASVVSGLDDIQESEEQLEVEAAN